jgi:hypothetical protein
MNKRNLHPRRALRSVLLVLLLNVVGMTNALADQKNHDFTAVAPNGQTLYYKITSTTEHTVMVTHPNDNTDGKYYYNSYGDYYNCGNGIKYYNNPYFRYATGSGSSSWNYYTKPSGNLIIPYYVEYNGISYSVTAIDSYAFGTDYYSSYACTGLTSVVIPSSVLTIGTKAFANCTGLTTVTIPTSVTSIGSQEIGSGVFHNCSNLVTVNFNATNCSIVGNNTWDGCTKFTTLNLGNTVTRIPTRGFQGATKLVSVSLPNSLTTINSYGFDGCTSLTTVTCGNASTLTSIGSYAFNNCSNLSTINLPNTLTSIGNYAFSGCTKLKSTTATQLLPNALTSIGDYAFQNAGTNSTSALTYIRIPSTLTSLGKYAFKGCTRLTTVDFEATNCTYSGTQAEPPFYFCSALASVNVSGNVTQIPAYCFKDCTALANLVLRNGLTDIGTYAFYECRTINTLVLPVSVASIGNFAFGNAYDMQLTRVESHNPTPPTIGETATFPSGQSIYVPTASVSAYQSATNWSNYNIVGMSQHYDFSQACASGQTLYYLIESETQHTVKVTYAKHYNGYYFQGHPEPSGNVVIPSTVTYNGQTYTVTAIDEYAFKDCVGMTAVTIPSTIASISEAAFSGCTGLITVNFNALNCTTMGSSASPVFSNCTSFTTLNIGTGVTTIPAYAFKNCTHLNCNLVFPNSMLTIGKQAFYGCSAMISQLNFPNAVTSISDSAFYNCNHLIGNLRLGTAVTTVGASAFQGCTGFTTLTMYNALEQIGASAFRSCTGLAGTVTIPNSVLQIGNNAFKDCTGITGLVLGTSLESIGDKSFENCTALAVSITLPGSVTYVGNNAFKASGITGITIPSTVTSMHTGAFMNCTSLTQVDIQNDKIATSQFEGCTALTSVTVPATVTTMLDKAFKNCTGLTSITLQNHLIGVSAFEGCTGLTVLDIPDCITSISDNAFYGCTGLTAVSVPYTVTSMGTSVFENCTSLTNVTLNNTVIASSQFKGCTGMTAFMIPSQIISVGEDALTNCSNLTVLNYNAEMCTFMGTNANPVFGGSTAITTFYIGANVASIANYAFKNCSSVAEIHAAPATAPIFTGNDTQYGFTDISQSIPVYVPCNMAINYQNATYWNHFSNYVEGYPYSVNVSSNNTSMGSATVTQAPSCANNGQTIVTATPNPSCFFINWTHNGNVVSTNATYIFTPTDNMNLMANFADSQVTISATADPEIGGTVSGGGSYNYGTNVTLTAVANTNYTFVNWTENGEVVSTNSSISFTATTNRNLVAHFDEFVNHWEPETSGYEDNMTFTCVLQLDGVEQYTTIYEVGAFCGEECRGSQRATYFPPTQRYIIQMTIFGEANDVISFRLYDHQQQQELLLTPPASVTFTANGYGSLFNPYVLNFTSTVLISAEANPADAGTITGTGDYMVGAEVILTANANPGYQFYNWTLDGSVVSNSASYQFTVTTAANYVANFKYVHTQALSSGWNWWSSYIELSTIEGLSQLENSIGSAGIIIKSRTNGYVEAYQYNGATNWYGTLNSINNEQMYKIRTNAVCNATIVGDATTPSNHPINIKNGWNWIGFPCNQSVSVDVAMSSFSPENNDVIKGRNGYTTYYADGNYNMWFGTLNTFEPGKGYMYRSNSSTQKTLVFQTTSRGETILENITPENNVFQPMDENYADNMTLTAVVDLDGEELRTEEYELAAFVGDECRGSVRLMYVAPVNRYIAFLTIFGELEEDLHFQLTDGVAVNFSTDQIAYAADGIVGSLDNPFVLHFGTLDVNENATVNVKVYPNPSDGIFNIEGQNIRKVEVFNAFGQPVYSKETENGFMKLDLTDCAVGIYLIRIITDNGVLNHQIIRK